MKLYTIDEDGVKNPSTRIITRYLPITNNNNVALNKKDEDK